MQQTYRSVVAPQQITSSGFRTFTAFERILHSRTRVFYDVLRTEISATAFGGKTRIDQGPCLPTSSHIAWWFTVECYTSVKDASRPSRHLGHPLLSDQRSNNLLRLISRALDSPNIPRRTNASSLSPIYIVSCDISLHKGSPNLLDLAQTSISLWSLLCPLTMAIVPLLKPEVQRMS